MEFQRRFVESGGIWGHTQLISGICPQNGTIEYPSQKVVRLTYEYRCEVFASLEQYKRGVEKRRETEQTIIDNVMRANKI